MRGKREKDDGGRRQVNIQYHSLSDKRNVSLAGSRPSQRESQGATGEEGEAGSVALEDVCCKKDESAEKTPFSCRCRKTTSAPSRVSSPCFMTCFPL